MNTIIPILLDFQKLHRVKILLVLQTFTHEREHEVFPSPQWEKRNDSKRKHLLALFVKPSKYLWGFVRMFYLLRALLRWLYFQTGYAFTRAHVHISINYSPLLFGNGYNYTLSAPVVLWRPAGQAQDDSHVFIRAILIEQIQNSDWKNWGFGTSFLTQDKLPFSLMKSFPCDSTGNIFADNGLQKFCQQRNYSSKMASFHLVMPEMHSLFFHQSYQLLSPVKCNDRILIHILIFPM